MTLCMPSRSRELDDPALLVRVLASCGYIAAYDAQSADSYFVEALGLARTLSDDWRLSQILGWQAFAAITGKGDPIAVRAAAEEGRDIADTIGDGYTSRMCRWCLALADMMQGNPSGIYRTIPEPAGRGRGDARRMVEMVESPEPGPPAGPHRRHECGSGRCGRGHRGRSGFRRVQQGLRVCGIGRCGAGRR